MEQRVGDSGIASARGTKKSLFLNDLKYFHVIDGLPPDIVHDIFEGLAVIRCNFKYVACFGQRKMPEIK